jgi:hypothetical protein
MIAQQNRPARCRYSGTFQSGGTPPLKPERQALNSMLSKLASSWWGPPAAEEHCGDDHDIVVMEDVVDEAPPAAATRGAQKRARADDGSVTAAEEKPHHTATNKKKKKQGQKRAAACVAQEENTEEKQPETYKKSKQQTEAKTRKRKEVLAFWCFWRGVVLRCRLIFSRLSCLTVCLWGFPSVCVCVSMMIFLCDVWQRSVAELYATAISKQLRQPGAAGREKGSRCRSIKAATEKTKESSSRAVEPPTDPASSSAAR